MSIITITSDFGYKDSYVSLVKAQILGLNPHAQIIDISHQVKPFNVKEGYFILNGVFRKFPKKTVHLFLVNEGGQSNDPEYYAFELEGHFFVCTGRSLMLLFDHEPEKVVCLPHKETTSFSSLENHISAACKLQSGTPLEEIGETITYSKPMFSSGIITSTNSIIGAIVHIDNYGNAITNITKEDFDQAVDERKFEISFGRERVKRLHQTYHQAEHGDPVCLFNENGFLEIALSFGNASRLMGLNVDDKVKIEFH